MEDHTQKVVNENPDSLKMGTPARGGEIKIYGNYDDITTFKKKIDNAKEVKEYAEKQFQVNI